MIGLFEDVEACEVDIERLLEDCEVVDFGFIEFEVED